MNREYGRFEVEWVERISGESISPEVIQNCNCELGSK